MDCIFCDLIEKKIPFIYEDDLCVAFHDMDPQAPMHFLIIPKKHFQSCQTPSPELAEVIGHIFSKIPEIAKSLGQDEYRIVNNNGIQAGQSVFHLHFHVMGGRAMKWPAG